MTLLVVAVVGMLGGSAIGFVVAWWIRRRTQLTIRHAYIAAVLLGVLLAGAGLANAGALAVAIVPFFFAATFASAVGRNWRLSDLGAGEDLRAYEQSRRWLWEPRAALADGERRYIAGQGQVVHERPWPASEPYVPMTKDDKARVPRGDGRHIVSFGATGSGKTTSVLRAVAGRVVKDNAALLVIDQKGDDPTEEFMRALAAAVGRPFVLFDPRADDTDRWQPIWGEQPAEVAARLVAGIRLEVAYYGDLLRSHVTIVLRVMHASGHWPPSFEAVVGASRMSAFPRVVALAKTIRDDNPRLWRQVEEQRKFLDSAKNREALGSGILRLDLAGDAWADVLEPRKIAAGDRVGVSLADAMEEGALVLWRTWVDSMPDAAEAITSLALADIHTAAQFTTRPWTVMLDEVGGVMEMAAEPTLALLQRGRSHGGQIHFITQSVADIEALTGQTGLLESLTDNFSAFIVHRQTSPESRDWLAKLMGTISLYGMTDQTTAHGSMSSGSGSRRRVRQFRVSADDFGALENRQAVVFSVNPPAEPVKIKVDRLELPDPEFVPRVSGPAAGRGEIVVHAAHELPMTAEESEGEAPALPSQRSVSAQSMNRPSLRASRKKAPPATPTPRTADEPMPPVPEEQPDDVAEPDLRDLAPAPTRSPARRTRKGKRAATPRADPQESEPTDPPDDEPPASWLDSIIDT